MSKPGMVRTAARHNLREIQAELGATSHIDSNRTHLNEVLFGPYDADGVSALAKSLMSAAGISKLRKDAVRAVELVVGLPPASGIDTEAFFADALAWARNFFDVPVLSAVVHVDEDAPHIHVLLLPLVAGRMVGSAVMGNRSRLQAMHADFHAKVGSRYGLARANPAKRLTGDIRRKAARTALECIVDAPQRMREPNVMHALLDVVAAKPEQVLAALGLSVPVGSDEKRTKEWIRIWTKPQKCESRTKPIGVVSPFAIEVDCANAAEVNSVEDGDANSYPVYRGSSPTPPEAVTYSRETDERESSQWDESRGEFREVPRSNNGEARREVRRLLSASREEREDSCEPLEQEEPEEVA
ncbi:plasmid recombination protein [Caballeronia catudaia]|uniref:plasmid recombination protein n=1 Tax=Caballeronia catudaia TaxID=1777136 RepID=UPI00135C3D2A|nr:plasmid recombination protein [Caballeronia catudaia]